LLWQISLILITYFIKFGQHLIFGTKSSNLVLECFY